jgi:hypothetical protein
MKNFLVYIFILAFSGSIFAQNVGGKLDFTQYGVTIQPDKRVIVVLASLEAAGVRTPLTNKGENFRTKLVEDLKDTGLDIIPDGKSQSLRARLTSFVTQYKKRKSKANDSEIIAPFISMAYALSDVPDLIEPSRNADLPGDLLDVLDYLPQRSSCAKD